MKKIIILHIVLAIAGNIMAQDLVNIDSLVIKLSVENETENWIYTFSFSEKGVLVQGCDYYYGCYLMNDEVSNYSEKRVRRFFLSSPELMNPDTNDNYSYQVYRLSQSILKTDNQKEILEKETTYDTVWHFSLYKDGINIGYYFFDTNWSCIRTKIFSDLCSVLRQIRKKRCPIDSSWNM